MKALSLFTGYGGIDLALKEYITEVVAYVEIDEFAQKIIAHRMAEGHLFRAPILGDVKNVEGEAGDCDIIYGGFPCQDISTAGAGQGLEGERSRLFFEILRLARETKPTFIFMENVPAIRTRGAERVAKELAFIGYDLRWENLSAQEIGANHKRERWFLLAANTDRINLRDKHWWSEWKKRQDQNEFRNNGKKKSLADSSSEGLQVGRQSELTESSQESFEGLEHESERCSKNVANAEGIGSDKRRLSSREKSTNADVDDSGESIFRSDWWLAEPNVGRMVDGVTSRLDFNRQYEPAELNKYFRSDRIKALGNGVVPYQVKTAFQILIGELK